MTPPASVLTPLLHRAQDSLQERPLLGDALAAETVRRISGEHRAPGPPRPGAVLAVGRTRRLDEWCSRFLALHPQATVLHLGCGLDDRLHRLLPPPRVLWYDVDLPEVVDLRRRLLPQRAGTRLVGTDVTAHGWLEGVPVTEEPLLVVAEGLLHRLTGAEVTALLRRITGRWDRGELVFDARAPWTGPAAGITSLLPGPARRASPHPVRWRLGDPYELTRLIPRLRPTADDVRRTRAHGFDRLPPGLRALHASLDRLAPGRPAYRTLRYRW